MPLTSDRNTQVATGDVYRFPVAAAVLIYAGAQVALNATGFLVPASASNALKAVGRADERVDNTAGADGDLHCDARRGIFRWDNSAGADEITRDMINANAFMVDDHTVAATDGTGARSVAGVIKDVDAQGVWVQA